MGVEALDRAERLIEAHGDEWFAKHERACVTAGIQRLTDRAKSALTLIGPKVAPDTPFAIRRCLTCTPPPEVFQCPLCDSETTVRWQYDMHMALNPKYCRDRAAKKARKWSQKV